MNHISRLFSHAVILLAVSSVVSPQRGFSQNAAFPPATERASSDAALSSAPQAAMARSTVETTVSVGAAGQLTASRITDNSSSLFTQSLSPSAGLLVTLRQSLTPWLGYSVDLGYTRATYRYTASAPAGSTEMTIETRIPNNVYETSVSYIAQKHLTPALTVFGETGAGAVAFAARYHDVRSTPANFSLNYRNNNFRPEGIAGFGVDYRLGHGLGLRAEYRGLVFKYPDYGSGIIKPSTISSAPTLSITYALCRHSKR